MVRLRHVLRKEHLELPVLLGAVRHVAADVGVAGGERVAREWIRRAEGISHAWKWKKNNAAEPVWEIIYTIPSLYTRAVYARMQDALVRNYLR